MAGCFKTCAWRGALLLVWLGLGADAARPEVGEESLSRIGLAGEAQHIGRRLTHVQKLVDQKQWSEAIDEYQQIIDEAGDELVPINSRHCVRARWLCHVRLAALMQDPTARRVYRERVDHQAGKWLEEGTTNRDTHTLQRLVDTAFCSRHADRALDLLGDLAFEQGRFEEAERWWCLLALPALETTARQEAKIDAQQSALLLYPDPRIDLAGVRARLILARLFRGERSSVAAELKAFRTLHPKAEGRLAGRTGRYADILDGLLARPADWSPTPIRDPSWSTFAGASTRSFIATPAPRLVAFDGPPRIVPLRGSSEPPEGTVVSATARSRLLAVHPVIVGEQVFVAGPYSVEAYDLRSGRQTGHYSFLEGATLPDQGKAQVGQERGYTLTVAENFVYARVGAQDAAGAQDSYLVGLSTQPDQAGQLVPRWPPVKSRGPGPESAALFEGAPVVRSGCVYIARIRVNTVATAIDCYDAETGALRWRQDVCETPFRRDTPARQRHHLLTLAGPNVVYCSHTGAVVALDAATGRRMWSVRYPSRGERTADGAVSPRDLAPCVASDGRLFVAPADFDRILCLDAATGQTLWESKRIEVVHLLGVARGRLIFTTGSYPQGIRALDAATGADLRHWVQPNDGNALPSFGRGLLVGVHVFWPTVNGLRILNQEDGQVAEIDPTRLEHFRTGNLAFGSGCLVVATARELAIYCSAGRELEQRKQEATARPQQAAARYRLAMAEADAGLPEAGLADFAAAERLARPEERLDQMPLREVVRSRRHEYLLEQADRAYAQDKRTEARDLLLRRAAAPEFRTGDRLRALVRLAEGYRTHREMAELIEVAHTVLSDPTLRQGQVTDRSGAPQQAAVWAYRTAREGLLGDGPSVRRYTEQARQLFDSAKGERRLAILEHLAREYAPAPIAASALLEMARLYEQAERFGAAAEVYRAYLRRGDKEASNALALAGLAQAYERQRCWQAARTTWEALAKQAGDQTVPAVDPNHTIWDFVSGHLREPPFRPASAAGSADFTLPLTHVWQLPLGPVEPSEGSAECLLVPKEPDADVDGSDALFFIRGRQLTCRDAATSRTRWKQVLTVAPSWIGQHADLVVTAGDEGIDVRRLADGQQVWQFAGATGMAPLSGFRLAGGRLLCLRSERQLLALDAESGEVLWSRWAPGARIRPVEPGGRFFPLYHAGKEWVMLQTAGGRCGILHGETGELAHDLPTSRSPWPCPPVALDERHICLVPDAHHVLGLDLRSGKQLWTHQIERPQSLSGEPPQMLADRDTVVLLVARNYGYELDCLDARSGARRWQRAPLITTQRFDLSCGALSADTVCLVHAGAIHARALADGRPTWERSLGGSEAPWQVMAGRTCWLAYPRQAQANRPGMDQRWTFKLLLCDRKDGQLVQCLNFAADGPQTAVVVGQKRLTILLGEKAWSLAGASDW
jgi:outer membrane protein assembly factor BamB